MHCKYCGNELEEELTVCPKCGKNPNKEVYLKGYLIGFVVSFFANLIGLILCLLFGDRKSKKSSIITFIVVTIIEIIYMVIKGINK